MRSFLLTFCIGLLFVAVVAQYSECLEMDEDCGKCDGVDINFSTKFLLSEHIEYTAFAYEKVMKYIDKLDPSEVIRMEEILLLHNFCCHTLETREKILSLLKKFVWYSFNVTMEGVGCNVDQHDNKTVYIWAYPDQESQKKMFSLVRGIESYLRDNGIDIHHSREQPFHKSVY